jgi:hypothetical protein
MKPQRLASVDSRVGRLFVASYSATAPGTFIAGDWVAACDDPVEDGVLGNLVRHALAASRSGVPYPDFSKGLLPGGRKLLKLADVKSEKQYIQGTQHVDVYGEDGNPNLLVTPYRNGGRRTGFTEMPDHVITLAVDVSDDELGAAVRSALAVATDGT